MRFRRAGSAALAAIMFASSVAIYAEAAEDKEMKDELTYVKQRVTIPEEYEEFSHSSGTEYGKKYYNFSWSTKDGMKGISVRIKGKVVTNYRTWDYNGENWGYEDEDSDEYDPNKPHFAKKSEEELMKTAKEWMKKLNPTINDQLKTDDENFKIAIRTNGATLRFTRMNGAIPVAGQSGYIQVNKDTGEVMNYNLNWTTGASFSSAENAISKEEAIKGYKEAFPAKLFYTASYDYETKEYTPYLVYQQQGSGEINAFTGKLSTFEDYDSYYDEDDDVAEAATVDAGDANPATDGGESSKVVFTDNELKKLEEEGKLVKADESMKKLEKDGIFFIPQNWDITNDTCNFDNYTEHYVRYISFRATTEKYIDINGEEVEPLADGTVPAGCTAKRNTYTGNYTINAETGQVLSFYCGYPSDGTTSLGVEKTKKLAHDYMDKLLGKDATKFVLSDDPDIGRYYKKYVDGKPVGSPVITYMGFNAPRVANGIESNAERVRFTIASNSKITNYNLNYYGIKYPKPTNIISADEAYKSFFEQVDYDMTYRCAYRTKDKKIVTALVYKANATMMIDAFTGKRTRYDGRPLTESEAKPNSYSDLKDSKYGKYAKKLLSYGVCIADEDGKLSENKAIDAATFRTLLQQTITYTWLPKDVKETTKVTNKLAAKLIVIGLYGNTVTSMKGIFKSPFSDVKDTDEYVGYIAIAKAQGLMKGTNGKFNPNARLTRGQAIKLIYDYLS